MKRVLLIAVIIMMLLALSGCMPSSEEIREDEKKLAEANAMLTPIETRYSDNQYVDVKLFYHKDTKIIYMLFSRTRLANGLTPFISENGNYMRYIDGKFMEINRDGELVVSKEQFMDEEDEFYAQYKHLFVGVNKYAENSEEDTTEESNEELDRKIEEIYREAAKEIEKLYREAENKK